MKQVEFWLNVTKPHHTAKHEKVQLTLLLLDETTYTCVEERRGCFLHIIVTGEDTTIDQLSGICPVVEFNEFLQP
jgi:hypothetical protein